MINEKKIICINSERFIFSNFKMIKKTEFVANFCCILLASFENLSQFYVIFTDNSTHFNCA